MLFGKLAVSGLAYRGGILSAQHGSWNRSTPVGARVMFFFARQTIERSRISS